MFGDKYKKMRKLLNKTLECIEYEKEIPQKTKEKILELSDEWNKERLFDNFVDKAKIFFTYDDAENFPVDAWVDSFFEKDYNEAKKDDE